MKILVFGASGLTGQQIVDSAVRHGHAVTAFVRNPSAFRNDRGVHVFTWRCDRPPRRRPGNVRPRGGAMRLGAATPLHRDPAVVTGVRNITATMLEADVRRLVYLSFLGVPAGRHQLNALGRYVMAPIVLRNVAADHAKGDHPAHRGSTGRSSARRG